MPEHVSIYDIVFIVAGSKIKDQNKTIKRKQEDLKKQQKRIARSEITEGVSSHNQEVFQILAENSPNMIFVNKRGRVIYANKKCEEIMGYSRQEFYAPDFDFLSLIATESLPLIRTSFQKHMKGEEVLPYEYSLIAKKGERLEAIITTKLIEYEGEMAILGVVTDITDRKRTEEALRQSEATLQSIFRAAPVGIGLVVDRVLERVNDRFCKMLGYSREELIGKSARTLYPIEGDYEFVGKEKYGQIAKKGIGTVETRFKCKDGRVIDVLLSSVPLDPSDLSVGVTFTALDITERKQAEKVLKTSLEEKEVMLREIHHRVKNNMQIISSLLRLQSRTVGDDVSAEKFKESQNRIKSMALIHESLYQSKDLSKIDFSEYIQRLARHLLSVYSPHSEKINLKLDVSRVYLDINKAIPCGLIINELVSNSIKHAFPEGKMGEITVSMHAAGKGKKELFISDNGIGFPKELKFDETETLGMQLIVDLIHQIGGEIEFSREGGTTFKITF